MAYELTKLNCGAKVLMVDKGAPLEKRQCPIKKGLTPTCVKCSPCHIMNGYGGAGTLSDGKYNITTQFGGELHKYVGTEEAMALMEYVDSVLCSMGGKDAKLYETSRELKTKALHYELNFIQPWIRWKNLTTEPSRLLRIREKSFIAASLCLRPDVPVQNG